MKELKLNELLRYGFAGAIFLVFMLLAFDEPRKYILVKDGAALITAGLFAISLTAGSVIYTLHRAIPYPFFYWVFSKLNKRTGTIIEMDIIRWKNLPKKNALQPRMGEWGAQVHFLYCIAWAGQLAAGFGLVSDWTKSHLFCPIVIIAFMMLLSAMWHHFRYQKWEKQVFIEDNKNG